MPRISVVLPVYNGAKHLSQAIDSIINQTFQDWELLVINEYGSKDNSAEIVLQYQKRDRRIRLIQNREKLGLAESLNKGIRLAEGEYIARLDADDTSHPDRLERQLQVMETAPEIGICGTWQHHFGQDCDYVHRASEDEQLLKARLLFWCDLCHSTVMMRKSMLLEHDLYYRGECLAEDFELWTRAVQCIRIVNIPEILGEYRNDGTGITSAKLEQLHLESGLITAKMIERMLSLKLTEHEAYLLSGWKNPLNGCKQRNEKLRCLEQVLRRIWRENLQYKAFEEYALLQTLAAKWRSVKYDVDWKAPLRQKIKSIDDVFAGHPIQFFVDRYRAFCTSTPNIRAVAHKVAKRLAYKRDS